MRNHYHIVEYFSYYIFFKIQVRYLHSSYNYMAIGERKRYDGEGSNVLH